MSLAPAVGIALGAIAGGAAVGVEALGAPPAVGGVLTVAALALLTRCLHLDGLADTADGLGSYREPVRALEIMKRPEVGPFGVVALVLVLLAQIAGVAALLDRPWWAALAGIVTAVCAGRLAITYACRRGVPAARPGGLGALVAGTVPGPVPVAWTVVLALAAVPAAPGSPWLGPVAVAVAVTASLVLTRHCVRRFGGSTGDVLGAVCEVATALSLLTLSLHPDS